MNFGPVLMPTNRMKVICRRSENPFFDWAFVNSLQDGSRRGLVSNAPCKPWRGSLQSLFPQWWIFSVLWVDTYGEGGKAWLKIREWTHNKLLSYSKLSFIGCSFKPETLGLGRFGVLRINSSILNSKIARLCNLLCVQHHPKLFA